MKVGFHPEAREELQQSYKSYRLIRTDLALRFGIQMQNAIIRISQNPELFLEIEPQIRRCLVKQFPYAVLFNVGEKEIKVVAVMHCSREPGYWRDRL